MKKNKNIALALFATLLCIGFTSCEDDCNHELGEPQISCQIHYRCFGAKEYNNVCIGTITASEELASKDIEIYNDWIDARFAPPTINDKGLFVYPVYADIEANTFSENTTRDISLKFKGLISTNCNCGEFSTTGIFNSHQWRKVDSELSDYHFIGRWVLTTGQYAYGTKYLNKNYKSPYMTLEIADVNRGIATNVDNDTEFPGSGNFTYTVNGDKITFKSGYSTTTYNIIVKAYNLFILEYSQDNSFHTLWFSRLG